MAEQKLTIYQKLQKVLATGSVQSLSATANTYNIHQSHKNNDIVDIARSPQERDWKVLQAKQQKLMARQWYRAQQDINNQSLAGLNDVRLMYRDVDLMDCMPEIGTALDIVSEEACLSSDTRIKLLDGTIQTIKELYDNNKTNFWVYSVNEYGETKPSLIDSVIFKGKQKVYEIILDDLTVIKCTGNHQWLLSDNTWKHTSNLSNGESLMSIYSKLDYKGYEKVKSTVENKFRHTHRIVAESVHYDKKNYLAERNVNKEKIVIHHSSFNKLNNDPNYLIFMYWNDHQKLHTDLNHQKWKNVDFRKKMSKIFSITAKQTWAEKGDVIKDKLKKVWVERKNKLTKNDFKKIYGRNGEQNGMFNVHRYGKNNPHFDKTKQSLSDINIDDLTTFIVNCRKRNIKKCVQDKFNLSSKSFRNYKEEICKRYNIKDIQLLKYVFIFPKLKEICQRDINLQTKDICKIFNLTETQLKRFMNEFGYKNFTEFKTKLFNHKILSITEMPYEEDVYDLKNSSCNNAFGVACNNGLIISHNCYVGESGSLINISSGSERVKGVLQDLFVNRLSVNTTLPMLTRSMIKYGNAFWLLHTDAQLGVLGWKELPVYEIERYENGMDCPYTNGYSVPSRNIDEHKDETRFIWVGQQQATEYRNWQIAHFRLLYDSSMLPYGCLVGDTRVETENGFKEIADIKIGDKIWTFNKNTHKRELSEVTMAMDKGVKETFLLETKHYYLEGTSDHKVLAYAKGELVYKEIGDLKEGDLIVCSNRQKTEQEEIAIDKSDLKLYEKGQNSTHWWTDYIDNIPEYVDKDFAKLFGFLLGDGWLSHNCHVMFALGEHKTLNDTYCDLLSKFSGKEVHFAKNANEKRQLKYHTAYVGSKMLLTILKRMGFNGNAYTKRIPSWIFKCNAEIKQAFLDGVIDANGSLKIASDKLYYNIELANEQLIKDIKTLAMSLGYRIGRIGKRNRVGREANTVAEKPIIARHESFYINFCQEPNTVDKINDKVEWSQDDLILEKVKRITPTGEKRTYDITVDNDNSNFFANGIVTHNCSFLHKARRHFRMLSMMEDMMFIYRLDRSIERRVFKINVGAIDEADVPSYVQQIADNFKRTPIIDPMTGQIDLRKNIMPVWKKTPIPLLDGRTITIEDLAKEYENGKINYVYSVQDKTKQIVPGKVVWCGKNYTAKTMVKITLDDDSYMVMAPEHEVVMRDGTKKRADKLTEGESVMPFYREDKPLGNKLKADYETIYNPNSGLYEFTHRLVAQELQKNEGETTIHHCNFNRHDNTPNNLRWMSWNDHKELHTSLNADPLVRKSRGELKHKLWNEGNNREIYCQHMKVVFDDFVWGEIIKAICDGKIYSQKSMVDFINEYLIDHLCEINSSRKLRRNKSISKMTVRERIHELGFKDFDEYIEDIEKEFNLQSHYSILNQQKSERAVALNMSKNFGEKRNQMNYNVTFDDFIWDTLRDKVLSGTLTYATDILNFINNELLSHINNLNRTNILKLSSATLLKQFRKNGFNGSKDYLDKIKKNHKVKKIEIVNGDDVYCMTVVGLDGEDDRHNFALRTFNNDESWNESGCFVSNCQTNDFFIPVREDGAASPIENLPAGQNLTAMDDIKYIQNKIVTALRVPKSFLNFEEAAGDGKNLSLLDVRFMRTVNRIQQALLLELNKIATIHLLMLGFTDDLTNFTLEMANPSSQAEMLELENLAKKVTTAKDIVSDPGGGMPIASLTWAWRHIFKWSDKEIQQNLEELRLETALAAELQQTMQIINRTHIFDPVDNIYGETGAEYSANGGQGQGDDGGMGAPGGGGGGLPMGGDMDFGDEMGPPEMGAEGDMDMGAAADEDAAMGGTEPPMEGGAPNLAEMVTTSLKKNVMTEIDKRKEMLRKEDKKRRSKLLERYMKTISDGGDDKKNSKQPIYDKAFFMNEEMNDIINKMSKTTNTKLND